MKLKFLAGKVLLIILLGLSFPGFTQQRIISNIADRKSKSLEGEWQYIIDPYETGFYNYRFKELSPKDRSAYWNSDVQTNKTDRKEFGYSNKFILKVPGDWNSQDPKFSYYEGTVWYKKSFDYLKSNPTNRLFLYFGAVNYKADVYLNGKKLGVHKGGFTPFNFEVSDSLLKAQDNFLVVKVDNKRFADEVPTLNTDWWNYGGITRTVQLIEVPSNFILDYSLLLKDATVKNSEIGGWVKLDGKEPNDQVMVEIPELKLKKSFPIKDGQANIQFQVTKLKFWSPETPKLYDVVISTSKDKVTEKIGFRTIEVKGKQMLLNGKSVFLRGICIHEEIPQEMRRAYSKQDARQLLGWAKDLSCNIVRLAHYPHNENMTRLADSLGLMVWSEIPVYWTINFSSKEVLEKAKQQLNEMISRDHNRASIILWSVGNETPVSPARTEFMKTLIESAKAQDSSRLITAALEIGHSNGKNTIDDPLGQYVDLVAVNEYMGWYWGLPTECRKAVWEVKYDKPLFFSETGAEAVSGFHADSLTIWSEEYQEWYFKEQVDMMKKMPDNYIGLAPWILTDFRSPKRTNPEYQNGWNNKGLLGKHGEKKKAFYVMKNYYDEMKEKFK